MRESLDAILSAETRAEEDEGNGIITPEDMQRADSQTLQDEAHLRIFTLWYTFGGVQRGLSPMEIAAMPASMMDDFLLLSSELARMRRRRQRKSAK